MAYPECYKPVSGFVSPNDVEWEQKALTAKFRGTNQFAVYLSKSNELYLLISKERIDIILQPSSFEIFTFSPVYNLTPTLKFASIGLENMFNSGGAIESLEYIKSNEGVACVKIMIKGTGKFLAYSSEKPKEVNLNEKKVELLEWAGNGRLGFDIPWVGGKLSDVLIMF
ncbi:Glycosyl hydrolases 36 [Macleaya cordata]|uniref:Glycosyl hydrolases 36 n=1 Tax=Macleaya cordata TaxID=56857 RepID=A0A200R209_MACCD|nr:Glycosyl hydrolases 36 [Macleaya cordata]